MLAAKRATLFALKVNVRIELFSSMRTIGYEKFCVTITTSEVDETQRRLAFICGSASSSMQSVEQPDSPIECKAASPFVSGTASPAAWFIEALGGSATASKVRVSPQTAMRCASVKRAVDLIGSTVGNLPVRLYKLGASEERQPANDHPAARIVRGWANVFTPARKFRENLTRDALLHGDGFAAVTRNSAGKPIDLTHLPPGSVAVEADPVTREPVYTVTLDGGAVVMHWRDVLHVMAPSLDGITGASAVHLGREPIGLALTLEAHAARLFGNGARPGGILSSDKAVPDDARARMKRNWNEAFNGEGSGSTAITEHGVTYKPITLSAVDAEFNATRRHQVREIANVFGIPATLLGDLDSATFSNAEALGQAFRDETILPWVSAWEDAYARALLTEEERDTHLFAFDLDALDRADLSAKAEATAKRRAAGITTANEERRTLNLPAIPGEGDVLGSPYTTPGTGKTEEAPANE